jgi:Ca2+:H+ antiporter
VFLAKGGLIAALRRSAAVVLSPLDLLLLAAPLAILAELWHWGPVVIFFASSLAIVPLARLIGVATESLAARLGPGIGGFLNATFGNATELIIAIVALRAGLDAIVKASLIGSILGNVLVVLGLSFLVGGARRRFQSFDRTAARAEGAQLAVAAGALLIPAILDATAPIPPVGMEELSIAAALVLLIGYGAGLLFTLRTHAPPTVAEQEAARHQPAWGARAAVVLLLAATAAVAVMSELLVEGVKGVTADLGWTPMFVGVVLVALIGNAAEHASAVRAAKDDQMDLSLAIALGSGAQIALFVAPLLVLLGFAMGRPMNLLFDGFEVAAVAIAVGLVNLIVHDGESTWLEGIQLLVVYAVLATAFFLHP